MNHRGTDNGCSLLEAKKRTKPGNVKKRNMSLMDDHLLKLLKYYAEMLEQQARANDSAVSTFLKGAYSITDLGKGWNETMAKELQGLANSALRLANEIRFKISH